jgi:hypothetical protein
MPRKGRDKGNKMERCYNTEALNKHLAEQEESDAAYEQDIQVAKELLGIDMEDDGLDSVLDCISKDEKHYIELLGKSFSVALKDGDIMDGSTLNAKDCIESLVWENDDLMEELAYCALQKPHFASRVNEKSQPEPDAPDYD